MPKAFRISVFLAAFLSIPLCLAHGQEPPSKDVSAESVNPVTTVLSLPVQGNFNFGLGGYDRTQFQMNLQPVRLVFKAGRGVRIRSYTIIPLLVQPDVARPEGGRIGLGDINFNFFLSNTDNKHVLWGIGPSILVPTATHSWLGKGKLSLGPAAVVMFKLKGTLLGFLANNVWSVAGSAERPKVDMLQVLFFFHQKLSKSWFLVSSPVVVAAWTAAESEKWLVPVGGGIGKIVRVGHDAVAWQAQVFVYPIHPRTLPYPDLTLRLQLQYIFLKRPGK